MRQPPDPAQIKDSEMKKVLHFAFPTKNLEVEWRFIFCERFPGAGEPLVDTRGSSGSRKKILPAACQEIFQKYHVISVAFLDSALLVRNENFHENPLLDSRSMMQRYLVK